MDIVLVELHVVLLNIDVLLAEAAHVGGEEVVRPQRVHRLAHLSERTTEAALMCCATANNWRQHGTTYHNDNLGARLSNQSLEECVVEVRLENTRHELFPWRIRIVLSFHLRMAHW